MSNILTKEDILACSGHVVAIDTETNGLEFWEKDIIGIGIHCPTAGIEGYVHTCSFEEQEYGKPRTRKEWLGQMDYSKSKRGRRVQEEVTVQDMVLTAVPNEIRIRHFVEAVQEISQNPKTVLLGHNLKFDAHFLRLNLWQLPCKILDTSVMVHLYDSRLLKSLGAAEVQFLGKESKRHHVTKAETRFKKQVWRWDAKVIEDYCVNDCIVTYQLAQTMMPLLRERGLDKLFGLQMKYLRVLQKMESRGILVATVFCHEAIAEFDKNLKAMEQDLFDVCGQGEFNWRSNDQLSFAIYDGMGIPKPKNPFAEDKFDIQNFRAGKLYTESATSTPLLIREKHPLRGILVDLRETAKLKEYAQKFLELRDYQGVIHASFNLVKTLTGRLSSSKPNLQQLPSEKRKIDIESVYTGGAFRVGGYNLRQALVARQGYTFVSIDHKQQEMRLLAILSQEPVMLEAMANREDIHLRVAKEVWGDQGDNLNKLHRDWSKAISFGLIYGLSEESLQEYFGKLGIEADARQTKEDYFVTFPGLRPWFDKVITDVRATGCVRYWSDRLWWAENPGEGYKGINALIQGGCADFMSVVVIRADQVLSKQGWGQVVSIIHDEVIYEVKTEFLHQAAPVLARIMEGEDIFGIPFATDVAFGDSYGTLEDYLLPKDLGAIDWKEYL
jgi:DNA polymerase-1